MISSRRNGLRMFFVAVAAVAGPVPAATPTVLSVTGTYVHERSKRRFPEQVGEFRRERVIQYDGLGQDVSVGYNLETPGRAIAATVYVYPIAGRAFSDEVAEVERAHNNVRRVFEQELLLERGPKRQACRMVGLSYEERFAGRSGPVNSYLLVCDDPPWRLKWRFTHVPTPDPLLNKSMKELAVAVTVGE